MDEPEGGSLKPVKPIVAEAGHGEPTPRIGEGVRTAVGAALETDQTLLNQTGLSMLREGRAEEFNVLRQQHPDWIPNFPGANLRGAKLYRADLSGTDLCGADLYGTNFHQANLSGADLSGTDLCGADLSNADLSGADLSRTNLSLVDLTGANLSEADLSGAMLYRAILYGADLSKTKGLTAAQFATTSFYEAQVDPELLEATFIVLREKNPNRKL